MEPRYFQSRLCPLDYKHQKNYLRTWHSVLGVLESRH